MRSATRDPTPAFIFRLLPPRAAERASTRRKSRANEQGLEVECGAAAPGCHLQDSPQRNNERIHQAIPTNQVACSLHRRARFRTMAAEGSEPVNFSSLTRLVMCGA